MKDDIGETHKRNLGEFKPFRASEPVSLEDDDLFKRTRPEALKLPALKAKFCQNERDES